MANPRGKIEQAVTPPSSDEAFHEMMGGIGSGISAMGQMLPTLQRIMDEKRKPLPFDVEVTAKSFLVPYISTSLLDMLEASILDPKAITDARILKGMCLELGLIDFLNPPWPDYVLDLAGGGEAQIRDAGNVLSSADKVGHPARLVEPLGILPEKVREDPHQGIEILDQKNIVVTSQKETYKLTRPGSEYVREIHKRPKVNALRKAISDLSSKISIGVKTPAGSITIEK